MAWNSRFKQASAARRRAKETEQPPAPRRIDEHLIDEARRASPEHFLRRHYPVVKVTKAEDTVWVPKVLRCDWDVDHWVSCGWDNEPIGDNVELVRWVVRDASFPDAIRELTGAEAPVVVWSPPFPGVTPPIQYPRLPPVAEEDRGRAYLADRGISSETIRAAEEAGLLRYAATGVIFLGRDLSIAQRSVRAATIRYYDDAQWDGDLLTKRDFAHTDKAFPGILPGDPARVLVVEGGVSALAARDIVVRQAGAPPTVIVSGGVNTRRWIENAPIQRILIAAEAVEIWAEHEDTEIKQTRTDAARAKLQAAIAEQRQGELPGIVYPPEGIKDAAAWNLAIASVQSDRDPMAP